ncbi:hypothetical protein KEH56_36550 [Burkholderia cenocepacia]|uniref:hypothetical protein n=1 Tax=Burkholderia cenocepacia TaxID=95486 RepID=UPI001BA593E3|nr:hypothetical protein [Burkholderia cenocepacia]QUN44683.1 hypothetical protein KEH56_36550 [Burkholderia cenocepacia]
MSASVCRTSTRMRFASSSTNTNPAFVTGCRWTASVPAPEKKQGSLWRDDETIDVLDFWGRVQGSVLQDWGIDVDDPQAQYECNAWLVGNYVIRALLNPDPLGKRPYRVTSFNKLPGQFWGEGIPQLVRDVQRTANSAARALIRNMSFASGPVVEIDVDRLDDSEDRPDKIVPWSIRYTKSSNVPGGGGPALRYNVAPSIAGDLQAIFTFYMRLADDFSGIPAYTYGNQEVGSAGRTMGGLSLLYGGALKGIKNVIMNIDRDCIEPMITSIWTHNMLYDPDPSIKADAKVIAKGSRGHLAEGTGTGPQHRDPASRDAFHPAGTGTAARRAVPDPELAATERIRPVGLLPEQHGRSRNQRRVRYCARRCADRCTPIRPTRHACAAARRPAGCRATGARPEPDSAGLIDTGGHSGATHET